MTVQTGLPAPKKTPDVLLITDDPVLALDFAGAFAMTNMLVTAHFRSSGASIQHPFAYRLVIVDADTCDEQRFADLRLQIGPYVPVVVIADDVLSAPMPTVDPSARFAKPVSTDEVAAYVSGALQETPWANVTPS